MSVEEIWIEPRGDGAYQATMQSFDGEASCTLNIGAAPRLTNGMLPDDDVTARAVLQFLMTHQDPSQLPADVELEDVLAAYDDAEQQIDSYAQNLRS
ncbi:hypothetical protein [Kocuria sp. TGY1127_2]|uniref:hypothetical protein n=1 Tax=Kocuria sp. TGY1127_2 TaxID=2711328 RepID=UPI0015B8B892|nr:hypothetical protein [Kocuria sp. TGY1127_2]